MCKNRPYSSSIPCRCNRLDAEVLKHALDVHKKEKLTCLTTGEKFPIASIMRRDSKILPSASFKTCKLNHEKP